MKILSTAVFLGPSAFAPFPVIYAELDLQGLEAWPTARLGRDYAERLLAALPGLAEHAPAESGPDSFAGRLAGEGEEDEAGEGLSLGLLFGHVAMEIERRVSAVGRPQGVRLRGNGRKQEVFFSYEDPDIALEAGRLAQELLVGLLPSEARKALSLAATAGYDSAGALRAFEQKIAPLRLGRSSRLILQAAVRRGIPWQRAARRKQLLELGQGIHRRRLQGSLTDRSPATAALYAGDPELTGECLQRLGLPTASGEEDSVGRRRYRLLVIGGRLLVALERGQGMDQAVTASVHPLLRRMAERAAQALGLEAAGFSYRAEEISQAPKEAKGAFVALDPAPKLGAFHDAAPEAEIAGALLERLIPGGGNGRVPIAAITGTNGKTTTTRMLARILEAGGKTVGFATTDGAYVAGEQLIEDDVAGWRGARAVLGDPRVEAAVLETARGGLLNAGAPFDRCDVGAITNVTSDHLGIDGVDTLDQLRRVKQSVIDASRRLAVLNADDPQCLEIAGRCKAERLCLITLRQDNEAVAAHLKRRGMALVLSPAEQDHTIVLIENGTPVKVLPAGEIPATLGGAALHNVQNAMVAIGMARGLGLPLEAIRRGLSSFEATPAMSPGRLNLYDGHPFTVVVDYAHNPEGFQVVGEALQRRYPDRRRIAVVTTLGCRHAEQIAPGAEGIAGLFDRFVCGHDDTYSLLEESTRQRGFPPEEIPARCAAALKEAGVAEERIVTTGKFPDPVQRALDAAESGDVLVIYTDEPQKTWALVEGFRPAT